MAWRLPLLTAGVIVISLGAPGRAGATSIDFSKGAVSIGGVGSILASYGVPGFTVSSADTYAFAATITNITGTSASPAMGTSFFDVLIEIEIDGTTHPCGSAPALSAGGALTCQVDLALTSGAHSLLTFLSLTFPNPVLLNDNSLFLIDTLTGNGPPVTVTPKTGGMSAGAKIAIIGAVAGGGAAAGIMATSRRDAGFVPEPGTWALVTLGGALLMVRVRRLQRGRN